VTKVRQKITKGGSSSFFGEHPAMGMTCYCWSAMAQISMTMMRQLSAVDRHKKIQLMVCSIRRRIEFQSMMVRGRKRVPVQVCERRQRCKLQWVIWPG